MTTEIIMPKLSDTMTEGHLGAWRKSVGERIERGDIIAEVETDKATMDLEAFTSGTLLEQRVQAGQMVAVGTVIGLIGEAGEMAAGQVVAASASVQALPPDEAPAKAEPVEVPTAPAAVVIEENPAHGGQAAPVVRRRAAELGIDLAMVTGSGPGGRVMLEDLERSPLSTAASAPISSAAVTPQDPAPRPANRMRSAIARTTTESWQTIPHFYLTREIRMDLATEAVRSLKAEGETVTLNSLLLSAVACALIRFPALNARFADGGAVNYQQVNLSFAVALPDGLQMPVIRDAAAKGVRELTAEANRLTELARQGRITLGEITGGSFSVSNLGMYGVDSLASIVMPGQAAILGLGAVAERPVVQDGQLAVASTMIATLSCDHRIIDGATAAAFLGELKRLLEHPAELPA